MFPPRVLMSLEADPSMSPKVREPGPRRPDISICVPVWKSHAPPDVATLEASLPDALAGLCGELIIVLNGLSPSKVSLPPDAIVIKLTDNRGVPVAWNQAAAAATADVLCFVNDDVVLGPSALRRLWEAARQRDAGVVGPVGTSWDIAAARHVAYVSTKTLCPGEGAPCDVVSGFLFMTRRDVFRAVGGFDEAYTPCGFEEVDYCTAVRFQLGLSCYAIEGIDHRHEFGISASRSWRRVRFDGKSESLASISRRNRTHFLEKWATVATEQVSKP
jgi:GT2 family glycosyltransferase